MLAALETPLGIVSGYRFAIGDWIVGSLLTGIIMAIEVTCATVWINAQAHEVTKRLVAA